MKKKKVILLLGLCCATIVSLYAPGQKGILKKPLKDRFVPDKPLIPESKLYIRGVVSKEEAAQNKRVFLESFLQDLEKLGLPDTPEDRAIKDLIKKELRSVRFSPKKSVNTYDVEYEETKPYVNVPAERDVVTTGQLQTAKDYSLDDRNYGIAQSELKMKKIPIMKMTRRKFSSDEELALFLKNRLANEQKQREHIKAERALTDLQIKREDEEKKQPKLLSRSTSNLKMKKNVEADQEGADLQVIQQDAELRTQQELNKSPIKSQNTASNFSYHTLLQWLYAMNPMRASSLEPKIST